MTATETWWENLFEGDLSLGIDPERLVELEDETFLYFKADLEETKKIHV